MLYKKLETYRVECSDCNKHFDCQLESSKSSDATYKKIIEEMKKHNYRTFDCISYFRHTYDKVLCPRCFNRQFAVAGSLNKMKELMNCGYYPALINDIPFLIFDTKTEKMIRVDCKTGEEKEVYVSELLKSGIENRFANG